MNYKTIDNRRKNSKFYEFTDGTKAVSSYNTLVAVYRSGVVYELEHAGYSPTTSRHYYDFRRRYDIGRETPCVTGLHPVGAYRVRSQGHEEWSSHVDPLGGYDKLARDLAYLDEAAVRYPIPTYAS